MNIAHALPLLPPSAPVPSFRIPALSVPRPVEVDASGYASWATTLPLYAADDRATVVPAVLS